MIARLLGAMGRSLFTVAVLLALAAALSFYGAYRLLRAAAVGAPPRPRQQALLGVVLALVELGRAVGPTLAERAAPEPWKGDDDG
jgi:hypothetical protein